MKKITIDTSILNVITDRDTQEVDRVESYNGSGLFDLESGRRLTTQELKREGNRAYDIMETLNLLKHAEWNDCYTDDDLNFISEAEYNDLSEETKEDFYQVEFKII